MNGTDYRRYLAAIFAVALTTLIRAMFNGVLHGYQSFSFYYPAILLVAWLHGSRAASAVAVSGAILGMYLFVEPQNQVQVKGWRDLVELITYAAISSTCITLIRRIRNKSLLAQSRGRELEAEIERRKNVEAALVKNNEELVKTKESLERADFAKDKFLAICGHELRTPLSAIYGWSRLLRSRRLDNNQYVHALDAIDRSVNHQKHIIEDLLDVGRITSGNFAIDKKPVSLDAILESSIESLLDAARAKHLSIKSVIQTRPWVLGDPVRLQQIVINLLTNAIKFTPEHGDVEIALREDQSRAEVTVTDNGEGIPNEYLAEIFQPFAQASSSARQKGGLGLGLAIVAKLVALHDGTIEVFSEGLGKGSKFVVRLPALHEAACPADNEAEQTTVRIAIPGAHDAT